MTQPNEITITPNALKIFKIGLAGQLTCMAFGVILTAGRTMFQMFLGNPAFWTTLPTAILFLVGAGVSWLLLMRLGYYERNALGISAEDTLKGHRPDN